MYTRKRIAHGAAVLLLTILACLEGRSQTSAQLIPKKGLFVTSQGLPWISGSEINFFNKEKTHHHYYFTWWEQDAQAARPGQQELIIGSRNTAVAGTYSMEQQGPEIRTSFDCGWNREEPGVTDIVYAKIWLPYLSNAVFRRGDQTNITDWNGFRDDTLLLVTPFGEFRFTASMPFKVRTDAGLQPGEKEYSRRSQYLLLYEESISVTGAQRLTRTFSITAKDKVPVSTTAAAVQKIQPTKVPLAWQPDGSHTLLLPQPKSVTYGTGAYLLPVKKGQVNNTVVAAFQQLLRLQWQEGETYYPDIRSSVNTSLAKEGYSLDVSPQQIGIQYHTAAGLQHALQTLVQLVVNDKGRLQIPVVKIKDEPSVDWRGIHMFTGPSSWALHRRMYDRVLLPLKMNKVVLQCEQAMWQSRPELHNPISVPMQDLKAEFDYLRKNNNEPIPLVQSLGHMEWFFKPVSNRRLAVNPEYPYTLNPDLPEAKEAVRQLWDETFALLQPQTMHIGFDEIGMIGFNQPKEKEVEFFRRQIGFLEQYARKKKARLMLWGDMGLGPGEGPDALNGVTKERAATIRSFIPKGAYVADWHYLNNPDPEVYKTNLRIWKKNGNLPLASPWLWPNNVRGFVHAAIDEKCGVLQTTWADFESSEKNMLLNIEQFGAYILALDYAWSGRKELPAQLPYEPIAEWVNRYYSQAKPVGVKDGHDLPVSFRLHDMTVPGGDMLPDLVELPTGPFTIRGFSLVSSTAHIVPEGSTVAEIQFLRGDSLVYKKELRYGVELRAVDDKRMLFAATPGKDPGTLLVFPDKTISFDRILFRNLHPASGFRATKFTLVD